MSIEIVKEEFKIEEEKAKADHQVLVETEIYLSTADEEVGEIIWLEGRVEVSNTMIIKDKLLVNGLVKYNIAYKAKEEDSIYSINDIKDFSEEIYFKGITDEMLNHIRANMEYTEYELKDNSLEVRTLINIRAEIKEIRQVETLKDIIASSDLEVLKENILYEEILGHEESYVELREVFKLEENRPAIERVIKFDLEAKEIESTVVNDRLIVSGIVIINLIYQGQGEIHSLKEQSPFNHFLEIPGVYENTKGDVDLSIAEASYNIREDEMGDEKLVDIEVKIKASGKVFDESQKDLIIDAYSVRENLLIEKEEINIPENIDNLSYKERLDFSAPINAIEILDIKGKNLIVDKKISEDGIEIQGSIDLSIYYIDRIGGELSYYKENYPYKSTIDYGGKESSLNLYIKSKLMDIDYNLKRDSLEIETNINHKILIKKDRRIQGIKKIEAGEIIDKKEKPSITVYIVQKDDILWNIAKRYNTRREDILKSNNLEKDYRPEVGDKIIIEKNLDGSI